MLWGGKANLCGIELVRTRCDRFLVIRLSGCLPVSQYPAAYCTGSMGEGRWVGWVGVRDRREEVGGGSLFKSEVYAVKLCTTPLWWRLCEKGNNFSCWDTFPPLCTFQSSFISVSFTCVVSLSLISHCCPVMLESHLSILSGILKKNEPHWGYCP